MARRMTPEEERREIQRIARESAEKFGNKASDEKFAWRNAQREALGIGKEKRKRGGAARVWDANKEYIKPIVTGAAGMIPGIGLPLAAGLGAAMGGFDREGKSGIGFDIGKGIKGGLAGATAGAAGAGVKGLVTGGMAGGKAALMDYGRQIPGMRGGAPSAPAAANVAPVATPTPALGSGVSGNMLGSQIPSVTQSLGAAGSGAGSTAGNLLTGGARFLKDNASWVGPAATAVGGVMGDRANMNAQQDMFNRREDREDEQLEEERQRRQRMAELLIPMYQQMQSQQAPPMLFQNR